MSSIPELSLLVSQVTALCRETGLFIAGEQQQLGSSDIAAKGLHDFVTYVDKTSEQRLISRLSEMLPGAAFLAEEGSVEHQKHEYTWIIDPLDGTTNFIHGLPAFSISIALQQGEDIILGVVHDIRNGESFHAIRGESAMCNGQPIKVSERSSLEVSLLATGFPYNDFSRQDEYLGLFAALMKQCRGIRRFGSAAIDFAWVACGRFDGFWEYGLKPWDVAAGTFIVKQAGGTCSDFSGGDDYLHGGELVCGNPEIHAELLELIGRHFK